MEEVKEMIVKHKKLTITAVVMLYFAYKMKKLLEWQKELSKICPGPKCHPLKGNLQEMIDAKGFSQELFERLHSEHGDVVRFFMGPSIVNVSINNPDLVHELYRKARERPRETYLFLWYLGKENLLFQRGKMVKDMRNRYGEMIVQRSQLDKLHAITVRNFRAEVDKWVTPSDTPARMVDLHAALGPTLYDIMGQVMFDAPWLATDEGREVYRLHKKLIMEVNRWVLWPVGPIFHPAFIDYLLTIRSWRNLIGSLLDKRAKEMRENPKKFENDKSAVHMILTSKDDEGKPFFSRERAISTMCGFLNGAYDTTHATTYWIFFHLAKNPECQTKLLDEFARVLGNAPDPTVDDLRRCDYLHAFLMESMRGRATVVVNQRVSDNEDVQIGEYIIPKGVNVNIPNCVTFNDERWFGPNTDKFIPERFMGDSETAERARKSWIAFGEHTRMCIGQVFALVELKAIIHTVVTRCTVEMEDPNDPGDAMLEAGVCQPSKHQNFAFRPRDLRKMREDENLKWWMQQVDAFEKIKPAAGTVAHLA